MIHLKSRVLFSVLMALVISCLSACATSSFRTGENQSFSEIQKAIGDMFPRGISEVSSNQREFTSKFFRPSELGFKEDLTKDGRLRRAQALVVVLGDRRPYKVEVSVRVEERVNEAEVQKFRKGDIEAGSYESDGNDGRLAKRLAEKIQNYLYQRSQNKNFIDDFRPF